MKANLQTEPNVQEDYSEDFKWVPTIAVILLFLTFIGAGFYVLFTSYFNIY